MEVSSLRTIVLDKVQEAPSEMSPNFISHLHLLETAINNTHIAHTERLAVLASAAWAIHMPTAGAIYMLLEAVHTLHAV